MSYNPAIHHRRSIRLRGYDYSQNGAYFVTICTQNRAFLFGEVVDGNMHLSDSGRVVQATWDGLPSHYAGVACDAFVVMPDHIHGIIILNEREVVTDSDGVCTSTPVPTGKRRYHGLPEIVRGFKTFSSRQTNQLRGIPGVRVWQRNYYEHIIRNESALNRIRAYIARNPAQWTSGKDPKI